MQARIRKYITGYLKIQITGYSPERFFNMCAHHKIDLWNLISCGHAYEMNISIHDFRRLKPILRKTKTKVKVKERFGFPFFLQKYKKRQLFTLGLIFCSIFLFLMTRFIWNIQIEGNQKYSQEEIRKALKTQDIYVGQSKKNVQCDAISAYLRKNYSDVIWVSASVEGIFLKIQVKENREHLLKQNNNPVDVPSDIIADKDGIITDIITRRGIPVVHIGDTVKKGDCLVSGSIPIYNDAKEIVNYQYVSSDADIFARTESTYEENLDTRHFVLKETGNKRWGFWIDTGNTRFYFGKEESGYSCYKALEKDARLFIGKQLRFPVSFGILEYRECNQQEENYEKSEARCILSANFQRFCRKLEEKGVQILQNSVKIYTGVEQTTAKGVLIFHEKIGNPVTVDRQSIPQTEKMTDE